MKARFFMALTILTVSASALAKTGKTSTTKTSAKAKTASAQSSSKLGANVGTDFQFNDLTVRGRYQNGGEGIATIENEKQLDDLLDYRTEYKDRILKSAKQL